MKKTAEKIANNIPRPFRAELLILVIVLSAAMFTGCEMLQLAGEFGKAIDDVAYARDASKRAKETTLSERMWSAHNPPFENEAEERLARRTSTLTGGTVVDVSPYLLHSDSFAVVAGAIQHNRLILKLDGDALKTKASLFEFDITAIFEANGQSYQMNVTAVAGHKNQSKAQNLVKKYVWQYAAGRYELNAKEIKKGKVQFNNTRSRKNALTFLLNPVFIQNVEPCYYQFDVEVECLNSKPFIGKIKTEHFAVFNKTHRSDFWSLTAAAVDTQMAIWQDGPGAGGPKGAKVLPIINFVRAEKHAR